MGDAKGLASAAGDAAGVDAGKFAGGFGARDDAHRRFVAYATDNDGPGQNETKIQGHAATLARPATAWRTLVTAASASRGDRAAISSGRCQGSVPPPRHRGQLRRGGVGPPPWV
jgi:hypothetical protein